MIKTHENTETCVLTFEKLFLSLSVSFFTQKSPPLVYFHNNFII